MRFDGLNKEDDRERMDPADRLRHFDDFEVFNPDQIIDIVVEVR
jgi:hypothetical protein